MTCPQRYPGCTLCGCDPLAGIYECSSNEGEFEGHYWEPTVFSGTAVTKVNIENSYEFKDFGSLTVSSTKVCTMPDC